METNEQSDDYERLHAGFRWRIPPRFNIGQACCGHWARATPGAAAIVAEGADGCTTSYTYRELQAQANRLSHALAALGVSRGDRVAIVLPQRFETAVAHVAAHQLGAVAMPLAMLFGPEALEYRLADSEAAVAIADESAIANLLAARPRCRALRSVVAVGAAAGQGDCDWDAALAAQASSFDAVDSAAGDPAILIYTSGTTGPPKGALLPHRALLGNLPGFVCSHNGFGYPVDAGPPWARLPFAAVEGAEPLRGPPQPAVFWSPADWAWTGGLMDCLLPVLYFGQTIVAHRGRFDPQGAYALMERYGVTNTFLFPTALKAMMKAVPAPRERHALALRSVMSAGESVGDAVFAYCRDALGIVVNEMFGQTEMNYIVGNCRPAAGPGWPARPGSMGRAYPGHRIAVIDDEGRECPSGTPGDVALHPLDRHGDRDPIVFLGYWRNDEATRRKYAGEPGASWCRTGDTAAMDDDGYLWYQGRSDDVFKAAGYRVGPSEIENCLVGHPAVVNAAVVPKPDPDRGALVKAYVVLAPGYEPSAALVEALQQHVRGRLAPYEYPKEIEFIDQLPMTTTGKVQRRVLRLQEEARARQAGDAAADAGGVA